jgi:hypothetical protein
MSRFIEERILNKIVKSLRDAGNPVVSVWNGEENIPATTNKAISEEVFSVDECHLYTKDDSWIFLVCGNDWEMLTDYTINLETALKPVDDYINKNMR